VLQKILDSKVRSKPWESAATPGDFRQQQEVWNCLLAEIARQAPWWMHLATPWNLDTFSTLSKF
jgi:hypothetical protein